MVALFVVVTGRTPKKKAAPTRTPTSAERLKVVAEYIDDQRKVLQKLLRQLYQ